jgi:hypothetical protein
MKLVLVKHSPGTGSGVNVYTADVWLSTVAGLHEPERPFVDVVGSAGTLSPAQITSDVPKLNVGTVLGVTVTSKFTEFAH